MKIEIVNMDVALTRGSRLRVAAINLLLRVAAWLMRGIDVDVKDGER